MTLVRVSSPTLFSHLSSSSSFLIHALLPIHSLSVSRFSNRRSSTSTSASFSSQSCPSPMEIETSKPNRWKPMCLYHTQGKCTMMDDVTHLEKFSHTVDLKVNDSAFNKLGPQNLEYLLVLDLEGKVEILEFPVLMIDAKNMKFIDSFHRAVGSPFLELNIVDYRFVRPTIMSEQRIGEYIEGKYGKFGVDRCRGQANMPPRYYNQNPEFAPLCVWHDTAIPFKNVLHEFEEWISSHNLWKEKGGSLNRAAFVTCGNWDLKTKIPEQCRVSEVKIPLYFMEWINLKDIYLNFYHRRATGMVTMMRELQMPLVGSHHLGIDDAKNIARVVQRMLGDGVLMQITARRNLTSGDVTFLFKNRIR